MGSGGGTPESVMRAIDTEVLVRLLARDHPRQAANADIFIGKGAWVSVLVLAEAARALADVYHLSSKDLARAIEMLLNHRDLVVQDSEMVACALKLFRAEPALSFSGCLTLESARKAGHLPLGTFDRTLAQLEGAQKL